MPSAVFVDNDALAALVEVCLAATVDFIGLAIQDAKDHQCVALLSSD
jgi:hypothetical protein